MSATDKSHPKSLLKHVETSLRRECELPPSPRVAIAVSGGPDSMALLHALSRLRERFDLRLLAITIDHGLRSESQAEVRMVMDYCELLDVPCLSRSLGLSSGGNLQERAREARYKALWKMAKTHFGEDVLLATAHHKDDRAETVLLRILRGTSLEGLSVLKPRSENLLRPLVRASKQDVLAHVERHGLPICKDPSNQDPRYLRVRTRHELLPLLKELGPGVVDHLIELSDDAGRLPEALGLNREQRGQIRAALRDRHMPVDLPLPGGLRLQRVISKKSAPEGQKRPPK